LISTIIMVYTLFSDDVREIFFPASADLTFSYITVVCMIYYAIEIIAFSLFQVVIPSFRKTISCSTISGLIS